MRQEGSPADLALPLRPGLGPALAGPDAEDGLARRSTTSPSTSTRLAPGWDRPLLSDTWQARTRRRGPRPSAAILLGPAYQLGLVRAAEEVPSGRRVVQLTPLGRYALALGPPPPPRPTFDHFLFVQPNFEIIAYRQGLTPSLIGQFSRFARWSQVGAALELKLTPDSVYRGLEGGLTTEAMLERLARHSPAPARPGWPRPSGPGPAAATG